MPLSRFAFALLGLHHQSATVTLVQSSSGACENAYSYLTETVKNPGEQQRPMVRRASGLRALWICVESACVYPAPKPKPQMPAVFQTRRTPPRTK